MTYLTIEAINSNTIFSPLGHEEEFKRRIFLENFERCMTIREFQKTAGKIIKKKVNQTNTAKIIEDELNHPVKQWKHCFELCSRRKSYNIKTTMDSRGMKDFIKKTCYSKKGLLMSTRYDRVYRAVKYYIRNAGYKQRDYDTYKYTDYGTYLQRMGLFKFLEQFDFSKRDYDVLHVGTVKYVGIHGFEFGGVAMATQPRVFKYYKQKYGIL